MLSTTSTPSRVTRGAAPLPAVLSPNPAREAVHPTGASNRCVCGGLLTVGRRHAAVVVALLHVSPHATQPEGDNGCAEDRCPCLSKPSRTSTTCSGKRRAAA